jgi:hypothetical protein
MKKIFFSGIFLALLLAVSCSKDEYTEKDATKAQLDLIKYQDSINQIRDSLNHLGGIIQYSVSVVPVNGGGSFLKSGESAQGLSGAIVTVAQHGMVKTDTAGASGICVFDDLRVGTVSVNVRAANYTGVDFIAEILPESDYAVNEYYNVLRYAATMVPMFSLTQGTSTISGKITYETNLTNMAPEPAVGIRIIAIIDTDDSGFINNYFKQLSGSDLGKYNAEIVQVAFTDLIGTATTDTVGKYSIQMPSTSDGLPVKLEIDDIAVDQQLLMNTVEGQEVHGVQTIRTIFSSNLTTSTASAIPNVPAAYAVVGAPTGTTIQEPTDLASATAVIGESGISSIIISNQGSGYTQAPIVKIKLPLSGFGEQATAVAYISNGKVTSIQITNPGSGYTSDDVAQANFIQLVDLPDDAVAASATPNVTYSILSYTPIEHGSGYKENSVPEVKIISSTGSGATAKAIMSGYITKIDVTNQGSDYTCIPNVIISGSAGTDATATATMTQYNPVHSIELTDNYTSIFEVAPEVIVDAVNTGSGTTAIATLASSGSILTIDLTNAGLGYTQAPTVLIVGGGGMGAVAYSTLNPDGSINVFIAGSSNGSGYTSVPTVQISAPPAGGVQAEATVTLGYTIESITLTNPGSGYNFGVQFNPDDYQFEPDVIIDGSTLADDEVIVRPSMKVEQISFTPGSGYVSAPTVTIAPSCGAGSGATAVASILFTVDKLEVLSEGSGYTSDADIKVTIVTPAEGCEEQAKFVIDELGHGVLSSITLDEGGNGYTAAPNVLLRNSSNNIMNVGVSALISGGSVTGFTITDNGGNLNEDNYTISISTHVGVAEISNAVAYTESGKISYVTITGAGAGYVVAPSVTFKRVKRNTSGNITGYLSSEGFIDAQATAKIEDGRVTSIEITNPGTGYYYEPEVVLSVGNTLTLAKANLTIVDGYITGISVVAAGSGYSTAPQVTILPSVEGVGSGATAIAVINNHGQVQRFVLTNSGSGYVAKNYPSGPSGKGVSFVPSGAALSTFSIYATKTYIRDIYLGTGKRTVEQ